MSLTFPVDAKLKDGSPVQLVLADERDVEPLRRLYRIIVEEGTSYPHEESRKRFLEQLSSPIQKLKSALQGQRYWVKQLQLLDETVRDLEAQSERITVEVGLRHLRQLHPQVSLGHAYGVTPPNHLRHFSRPCTVKMSPTTFNTSHSM
jgi:hypothetical protein